MDRIRVRVKDKRVLALVTAFLKAGILTELGEHRDSPTGTPQGGILSPSHGSWGDALLAAGLGLCLASVYYSFALLERRRQRRLIRLGLWRGTAPEH